MRTAVALALSVASLLIGCGGDGTGTKRPAFVEGEITELERTNGAISALRIRNSDGKTYVVRVAEDVDYGFDLEHLTEHERLHLPVYCDVEERDGRLYARTIDDA